MIMNKTDKKIRLWYPSVELGGGGYLSLGDPMDIISYVTKRPVQESGESFCVESITLDCSTGDRVDRCNQLLIMLADHTSHDELPYLPEIIVVDFGDEVAGKNLRAKVRSLKSMWNRKYPHKQSGLKH